MNLQVNKKHTYDRCCFEIVGHCNAKCRYCPTGSARHPVGGFIDSAQFEQALNILFKHNLIHHQTCLYLFNWGEPTLHPEFGKIINIIQNAGGGG
jgi:MoaA/NifB/PqqE/SkfB family radical SAM enzyme